MIPGELILKKGDIICNKGKKAIKIDVENSGDRPIQVGSHFHFFEVNKFLKFDRELSFGMRLNIPGSTAIRFEPGEKKQVMLIPFGGNQKIFGFNNLTDGDVNDKTLKESALNRAKKAGFK